MMLPEGFVFSQGSLQDFVDCKRRFQLKALRQQAWPALEVEPALEHELHSLMGQQFHSVLERYYLMRQYLSDIEAQELVGASIADEGIRAWWQAFLDEPPLNVPEELVVPEARIALEFAGHKLVAVFDLLAIERGQRVVIADWKTAYRRPTREVLAASLQTRVYPFVVVQGAADYFGKEVDPARVTMVYWYANYPDQPHVYHYSDAQYEADRMYLAGLFEAIEWNLGQDLHLWDMTSDERLCRYCAFRSFCGRGVAAGDFADIGLEGEISFDLLDELEY